MDELGKLKARRERQARALLYKRKAEVLMMFDYGPDLGPADKSHRR
jgi:hypothetical protein